MVNILQKMVTKWQQNGNTLPLCYYLLPFLVTCYHFVTILLPFLGWKCLMTSRPHPLEIIIVVISMSNLVSNAAQMNQFNIFDDVTDYTHTTDKLGLEPSISLSSTHNCVRVLVFMLCMCTCVHVAYVITSHSHLFVYISYDSPTLIIIIEAEN